MYRSSTIRSRSYSPPPRSRSRAASRRAPDSQSPSPQRGPPRAPSQAVRSPRQNTGASRSNRRSRAYPPGEDDRPPPSKRKEVTLLLCVFHSTSHNWSTHPVTFRPDRINDRDLWEDIRYTFRTDLQKPWRRFFGFKRVKNIVPIAFSPNMVPLRTDPKDFPSSRQLVHSYHHPQDLKPDHRWVDYFSAFDAGDSRQNGLEFVEGLWAGKLFALALMLSLAIIVVSIVWCAKGGDLQTVFSVMGFVLTFVAAEIALIALYYQIISGDSPSSSSSSGSN